MLSLLRLYIMQILEYFKKRRALHEPWKPSEQIGRGVDGEVFDLVGFPNKVIKLCKTSDFQKFESFILVVDRLFYYPTHIHARVYDRGGMSFYPGKEYGYALYWYVMEKLLPISDDEQKVFHTILSHEDRNIVKNYTSSELEKILEGLRRGLDFDAERVKFLCDGIRTSPIKHLDIHPRNIMKNAAGDFKLIDFDRVQLQ